MLRRSDKTLPKIQIELLQAHGKGGAFLTQTVPMAVWTDVELSQMVSTGLSIFDRFTLECLVQLGDCSAEDLCEVIGIDEGLAHWWLEMIEIKGLATKLGETTFLPKIDLCLEALASNSVPEKKEVVKTIIWFAQTSEMVVLSPQDSILKTLSKIDPLVGFPLTDEFDSVTRGELIERCLEQSLLYGSEAVSIVGVRDSKNIDTNICPAYQLEVDLEKVDEGAAKINIYGYPAQKGGHKNKKIREIVRESISVPIPPLFINASLTKLGALSNNLCDAMERDGLLVPKIVQNRAQANLDYDKALSMTEEGLLNCHKRIRFAINDEIAYEIPLELVPADDKVGSLIQLDSAVRAFLAQDLSDGLLGEISGEYGVPPCDISQRLWQVRQYAAIYQLREQQDFGE